MKLSLKRGQKVKCLLKDYGWVNGIYEGNGISVEADSTSDLNGKLLRDGSIYLSTKNYKIEDARIV